MISKIFFNLLCNILYIPLKMKDFASLLYHDVRVLFESETMIAVFGEGGI